MTTLVAFALGLILGGGVGVLIMGVRTLESRNDDLEEAQHTIKKQAKIITDQSLIISELNHQLDGLEDDGK